MSAVDRAAEVIDIFCQTYDSDIDGDFLQSLPRAISDAGLLVTDEIQAVLNAAVQLSQATTFSEDGVHPWSHLLDFTSAVDAYLLSREGRP